MDLLMYAKRIKDLAWSYASRVTNYDIVRRHFSQYVSHWIQHSKDANGYMNNGGNA